MRRALVFGLIAALTVAPIAVASVRKLNLSDLSHGATQIVHGNIIGSRTEWQGGRIMTVVTVQVSDYLKGTGGSQIDFRIPGGRIGSLEMKTGDAPVINVGEEVVLFLRPNVCPCDVYGWFQGKFTVVNGMVRELHDQPLNSLRATVANALKNPEGGK